MTTTPNAKAFIERLLAELKLHTDKMKSRKRIALIDLEYYINQHRSEWDHE